MFIEEEFIVDEMFKLCKRIEINNFLREFGPYAEFLFVQIFRKMEKIKSEEK